VLRTNSTRLEAVRPDYRFAHREQSAAQDGALRGGCDRAGRILKQGILPGDSDCVTFWGQARATPGLRR